jgi:hypothetical protein
MAKTFVAIGDPVHSLLRTVTRHTPLGCCAGGQGLPAIEYQVRPEDLPPAYYALAVFHKLDGVSWSVAPTGQSRLRTADKAAIVLRANFFDATCLDARCCRDLRIKVRKQGPEMLAGELLAFGTGTLRARNDDLAERMHHYLWSHHGRVQSRHEVVYARIRALHWNSLLLLRRIQKESFDSTNVIYGDALGEVEQLWDRRADTAFLELVVQNLQQLPRQAEIAAFLHPPLNLPAIVQFHRRAQTLWRNPPASSRALLRRIEYILEHTRVDTNPKTEFRWREHQAHSQPRLRDADYRNRLDSSGYDGWLRPGATESDERS